MCFLDQAQNRIARQLMLNKSLHVSDFFLFICAKTFEGKKNKNNTRILYTQKTDE